MFDFHITQYVLSIIHSLYPSIKLNMYHLCLIEYVYIIIHFITLYFLLKTYDIS